MPTVLRIRGYRFHFYSDAGLEPPHIHVAAANGECKFWLEPIINLARNRGMRPIELRSIEKLVFKNKEYLLEKFYEFHKRQKE